MPNRVDIHLFGHPTLRLKGKPLTPKLPKKALALLYYVAVAKQPVAREAVAALLWPDARSQTAKHYLRNLLSKLRKELPGLLEINARTIVLQPKCVQGVDVIAFQQGLAVIQETRSCPKMPDFGLWQTTAELYQGEFLEGFYIRRSAPFEEWLMLQREYLREQAIANLLALSAAYAATDEADLALTVLARLLQFDPWHETAYTERIQLLLSLGRRTEALQQYERCQQVLANEFGLPPSPALRRLAEGIRSSDETSLGQRRQEPVPSRLDAASHPISPHHASERQAPSAAVDEAPANSPDLNQQTHRLIPNNLAHPLNLFVGREEALAHLHKLVTGPTCHLLTVVGPGGMGKTSLAQAFGQRLLRSQSTDFPDGLYFIPLSGIEVTETHRDHLAANDNPAFNEAIGAAIAEAIAEGIDFDIQSGISCWDQLQAHLRPRRLLLILDNFEQLVSAAESVVALLTNAPYLTILVTSRVRLNVMAETLFPLDKLSLPHASYRREKTTPYLDATTRSSSPSAEQLVQESEAVALFVQCTQRIDRHFALHQQNMDAVVQICRLVDGLPLGIELATSMLPMLGCAQLAKELAQSLNILAVETRDRPDDQRTLQAVFERSWRLLSSEEQFLLAKLSIFPNTFDYTAAQVVANATLPLHTALFNQSLLNRADAGRSAMHRSIREFARQKLQQWPTAVEALQQAYARYYLDFLSQKVQGLAGYKSAGAVAQISVEMDNIRAAWRWAVAHDLIHELNQCLGLLFLFQEYQGLYADGQDLFGYALDHFESCAARPNKITGEITDKKTDRATDDLTTLLIGRLYTFLGCCRGRLGQHVDAEAAFRMGLSMLQHETHLGAKSFCLGSLGNMSKVHNLRKARLLLEESVALAHKAYGNEKNRAQALVDIFLCEVKYLCGDYAEAALLLADIAERARQEDWGWCLTNSLRVLGLTQIRQGKCAAAAQKFEACMEIARQNNHKVMLVEMMILHGEALRLQGRLDEAQQEYAEAYQLAVTYQFPLLVAQTRWAEGCLAEQRGDYAAAKALLMEHLASRHPLQTVSALPTLGWALIGLDELDEAQDYFQNALENAEAKHAIPICMDAQVGLARIGQIRIERHAPGDQDQMEEIVAVLLAVDRHPAATHETRRRIEQINLPV